MSARPRHPGYLALAMLCGAALVHAQKPAAPDVLKAAGDYLLQYAQKLSTIAAEEEYIQREPAVSAAARRLQADIVLVGFDDGMVSTFRDVFAVDGRPRRERDDRLLKLFQSPTEAAQEQARAWGEEGAGSYISPNLRTMDLPTLALEFLRQVNQEQSEFSLDGVRNQDGASVATLKFKARPGGRVLPTPEGATTTGRAWVEVGTGTVRQTELLVSGKNYSFMATTKYALEPSLQMWLPSEFTQRADLSAGSGGFSNMGAGGNMGARQSLEARARYTRFRREER